jgi:hypothetical protein
MEIPAKFNTGLEATAQSTCRGSYPNC